MCSVCALWFSPLIYRFNLCVKWVWAECCQFILFQPYARVGLGCQHDFNLNKIHYDTIQKLAIGDIFRSSPIYGVISTNDYVLRSLHHMEDNSRLG